MSKFKEITRDEKIQKIDENLRAFCFIPVPPMESKYPIIN
jgi:hypothetical protein